MLHNLKIGPETRIGWCAQNLNYGTWYFGTFEVNMSHRNNRNILGIFRATKIVAPLESGQNGILAS